MAKPADKSSRGVNLLRRILFLGPHTCPWWLGYTFDNPLRQLFHDPLKILGEYVSPGQTVVDIGCGLGYFSLALARIVGPGGRVIAVDVQPQMVQRAKRRAQRQGLADRIDFRICSADRLGVTEPVDFVLAFWVMHEVVDAKRVLAEVRSFIKPESHFMITEPKGHVSAARFDATIRQAQIVGFNISTLPQVCFSRSAVLSPRQGNTAFKKH